MAIGNGFIDPRSQYGSELDMMVEAKIWEKGSKVCIPMLRARI